MTKGIERSHRAKFNGGATYGSADFNRDGGWPTGAELIRQILGGEVCEAEAPIPPGPL